MNNEINSPLNKSKKEITEYLQKCTYSNLSATLHLASQTKNRGTIQWAEESQNSIPQRKRQKTNKNSQWAERKNSPFIIHNSSLLCSVYRS